MSAIAAPSVTIIGDGLSGALLAIKLAAARPEQVVQLVGDFSEAGGGIAYGRCAPHHILNVPVSRMEVGLRPSFHDWLQARREPLDEALKESGGSLPNAFVPRRLFGNYIGDCLHAGLNEHRNLRAVTGEAVAVRDNPRSVLLADGKTVASDIVVLATGHLPPTLPFAAPATPRIIRDPWLAWPEIAPDATIVLAGTGLTMVDAVLSLRAAGHRGKLVAISRHGRLPRPHCGGGTWDTVAVPVGATPRQALQALRAAVRAAEAAAIPWQRVFDALRPAVASIWHRWPASERSHFLRHLRAPWDVHRHRMAPRIASQIDALQRDGTLSVSAARIIACDTNRDNLALMVRPRGGRAQLLEVDILINCTGTGADPRRGGSALLSDLIERGLAIGDPLGLGLETDDCALLYRRGQHSSWLYAIASLTRPAWWEVVAVPEINAQIDRLVQRLTATGTIGSAPLHAAFLDLGAGI